MAEKKAAYRTEIQQVSFEHCLHCLHAYHFSRLCSLSPLFYSFHCGGSKYTLLFGGYPTHSIFSCKHPKISRPVCLPAMTMKYLSCSHPSSLPIFFFRYGHGHPFTMCAAIQTAASSLFDEEESPVTDMLISQMMFVSGETVEPTPETTTLVEQIVQQQVMEMVKPLDCHLRRQGAHTFPATRLHCTGNTARKPQHRN